jgi:hypothetical protein
MAFSNSPQFETYKTIQVKFDATPTFRSGDTAAARDSAIRNMFYDRVSQENKTREVSLKKRPGLVATTWSLGKDSGASTVNGHYYDSDSNRFYWAVNSRVYYVAPNISNTPVLVATLTTSGLPVGFCEFLRASDMKRFIAFSDGQELWLDEIGGTATKVTDADLPVPHLPQPVQLDGYLFVAAKNTNDLYNSVNDDPFSWEPTDYISAEMTGDYITKLATNRNYIVAFGTNSLEIFWNAAVETGSPMKRNESGFKRVGYLAGICTIGDKLYFVGQDQNKTVSVYVMDGFKLDRISNEVVDRSLEQLTTTQNGLDAVSLVDGITVTVDGHSFYLIQNTNTCWAYDLDEKMWYEWLSPTNDRLNIQAAWAKYGGGQYVAVGSQTTISLLSPAVYQDFGANFTCRYVTEDIIAGTLNWKSCSRAMLQADRHLPTGTSNVQLSWSDDDWNSSSTVQSINVFSASPYITRLGRFRTRSFKLEYADNYPLRMQQLDLDINVGSS